MANKKIEQAILAGIISNEKFCRKVVPHIKSELFEETPNKALYAKIVDHLLKFRALPSTDQLKIVVESNEELGSLDTVEKLSNQKINFDWLLSVTEKWCVDRSIEQAIVKAVLIIDGKDKKNTKAAIPDLLRKALSITFDPSVGHDFTEDAEKRFELYHTKEDKIPFDLDTLNEITAGGVAKKTLNMLLGPVHGGKTLVLTHLAASYLNDGHNVLFISMEMAEESIAERIDANLLDLDISTVREVDKEKFLGKIKALKAKTQGKLIIKQFPTGLANVNHFRALISECASKKDFVPDIVIIDYLNICGCASLAPGRSNSYEYVKKISEEMRGLAVEQQVPIWSATQVNRTGFTDSDPGMEHTSDSFGTPATADLFLAIIRSEQLDSEGKMILKQLKNRYRDLNKKKSFAIGVDMTRMRLYDLDNSSVDSSVDSSEINSTSTTPFAASRTKKIEGLKT